MAGRAVAQRDDPWILRMLVSSARDHFLTGTDDEAARRVIRSSWRRSQQRLPPDRPAAPIDADDLSDEWGASPLREPVRRLGAALGRMADDGDFVVAVTNPHGKILWSYSDDWMRRRAERVHFVPGGHWDEASMGTNALDLALRTARPQTVFSAEHFASAVEDWVCYAAPIVDGPTRRLLGVLDLSTTWNRAMPVGLRLAEITAAHLSELVAEGLPRPTGITLRVLGRAEVLRDGVAVSLTRRQVEILTILAMHPDGLSLDALHAYLYPDLTASPSTCKAEVSRLRQALGGAISSRPYRITEPVVADHVELERHVRAGNIREAVELFRDELLPDSEAPALVERRHVLTIAVRESVLAAGDPDLLVALGERLPDDLELHERGLAVLPAGDPRRSLLEARRRLAVDGV